MQETESDALIPLAQIPLHSTNLLTLLDKDGIIRYESPAVKRIYGYDPDELVGEQVAAYFHPDDRERVVEAFETVVASEEYTVEAVEYRHQQADGSYLWVESVASANPTPDGHYVVNTREISDRKQRERELKRTNKRLEAFSSMVSHDLRNPLNVAKIRLDIARDEGACDSEHFAGVQEAHERMESLIDDLLGLARTGNEITEVEHIDLAELSQMCWQTVATDSATLDVSTDCTIKADRSRLKQLLENVIRNAVEHGGASVTVTVGEIEGDGIYIEDDGSGIGDTDPADLFAHGYSTVDDGNGLGLAIVSEIADAHGWTVSMTESGDGGARVEITDMEFA